jgi:phage terminase large subunit-like protein
MRTRNPGARKKFLESLTSREAAIRLHDWSIWARDKQLPPDGAWRIWLILAGRGFGKTRTGAEWIRAGIERGAFRRVALVGETSADVRDVMVEGDSGILKISPPWNRPRYEPSKRRLTWPNGAVAQTYSADDPEQLRGPQFDAAWADEIAKWRYVASWDNLMLGLRLGEDPRCVATTTPRPRAWLARLIEDPGTVVTKGATSENAANLAPAFLEQIMRTYRGTRLARQEIDGEMLTDTPGALWRRADIDRGRLALADIPPLTRIVVAIDPAVSTGAGSDETGDHQLQGDSAGWHCNGIQRLWCQGLRRSENPIGGGRRGVGRCEDGGARYRRSNRERGDGRPAMKFLIDRARERSTWLGVAGLLSALGVALSPDHAEAIATAGTAVASLIAILGRDHNTGA